VASSDELLAALEASHDRLAAALRDQDPEMQSYDDDWSVGQVASHLGSSAEIFTLVVDAGAQGRPAPGMDVFQEVWGRWDAKSATDQARDSLTANRVFLDRVAGLSDEQGARWRLDLFGSEQTLTSLLGMRLGEHAVHTWDVVVAADRAATVDATASGLVISALAAMIPRAGKPTTEVHRVRVTTTEPTFDLLLELTPDGPALGPADNTTQADATLRLPAEAFLRLVFGRLDPDHTPDSVEADGIDLELLRTTFPGF
jgi:uncharacterized protein (TIGR03083 family)